MAHPDQLLEGLSKYLTEQAAPLFEEASKKAGESDLSSAYDGSEKGRSLLDFAMDIRLFRSRIEENFKKFGLTIPTIEQLVPELAQPAIAETPTEVAAPVTPEAAEPEAAAGPEETPAAPAAEEEEPRAPGDLTTREEQIAKLYFAPNEKGKDFAHTANSIAQALEITPTEVRKLYPAITRKLAASQQTTDQTPEHLAKVVTDIQAQYPGINVEDMLEVFKELTFRRLQNRLNKRNNPPQPAWPLTHGEPRQPSATAEPSEPPTVPTEGLVDQEVAAPEDGGDGLTPAVGAMEPAAEEGPGEEEAQIPEDKKLMPDGQETNLSDHQFKIVQFILSASADSILMVDDLANLVYPDPNISLKDKKNRLSASLTGVKNALPENWKLISSRVPGSRAIGYYLERTEPTIIEAAPVLTEPATAAPAEPPAAPPTAPEVSTEDESAASRGRTRSQIIQEGRQVHNLTIDGRTMEVRGRLSNITLRILAATSENQRMPFKQFEDATGGEISRSTIYANNKGQFARLGFRAVVEGGGDEATIYLERLTPATGETETAPAEPAATTATEEEPPAKPVLEPSRPKVIPEKPSMRGYDNDEAAVVFSLWDSYGNPNKSLTRSQLEQKTWGSTRPDITYFPLPMGLQHKLQGEGHEVGIIEPEGDETEARYYMKSYVKPEAPTKAATTTATVDTRGEEPALTGLTSGTIELARDEEETEAPVEMEFTDQDDLLLAQVVSQAKPGTPGVRLTDEDQEMARVIESTAADKVGDIADSAAAKANLKRKLLAFVGKKNEFIDANTDREGTSILLAVVYGLEKEEDVDALFNF